MWRRRHPRHSFGLEQPAWLSEHTSVQSVGQERESFHASQASADVSRLSLITRPVPKAVCPWGSFLDAPARTATNWQTLLRTHLGNAAE